MSKPQTLMVDDVKYVREDSVPVIEDDGENFPYEIGQEYHIETVTKFYLGRLISVTDTELVMDKASWVADTGRYNEYAKGGKPSENEPIEGQVIISRGAIVMAVRHGITIEVL